VNQAIPILQTNVQHYVFKVVNIRGLLHNEPPKHKNACNLALWLHQTRTRLYV